MLVNYVSFRVETEDRAAFDAWYSGLVSKAQTEEGCLVYEYFTDPNDPDRGVTLAAWRGSEDLAAHRLHPSHIELVGLGSSKWGMRDFRVHSWTDVGGYRISERQRIDDPGDDATSREHMRKLVQAYQESQPEAD